MKQHIILTLVVATLSLMTGCTTDEIEIYNTQNTPDLSNPIIQKVSNTVWYNTIGVSEATAKEIWTSKNNIYKPSDYASSLLYQAAWTSLTLYRDGTSNMVFIPPFLSNTAIHAKGNWSVSTEEENTIILSTKTPVSSVTGKIKVLNLETKDNVSSLELSLDFGDRLLTTTLSNENPYEYLNPPLYSALDYNWFTDRTALTETLKANDFVGAWANHDPNEVTDESIIRYTHIEDLLMSTPSFALGFTFNLKGDGSAQILYTGYTYKSVFNTQRELGKTVFSNAKWSVTGNKIWIETDEEYFMSIGEQMMGFVPYSNNQSVLGYEWGIPIRIRSNQKYSIEIITKTADGFWTRVTTKEETCYAFLAKSSLDNVNLINIKDILK